MIVYLQRKKLTCNTMNKKGLVSSQLLLHDNKSCRGLLLCFSGRIKSHVADQKMMMNV